MLLLTVVDTLRYCFVWFQKIFPPFTLDSPTPFSPYQNNPLQTSSPPGIIIIIWPWYIVLKIPLAINTNKGRDFVIAFTENRSLVQDPVIRIFVTSTFARDVVVNITMPMYMPGKLENKVKSRYLPLEYGITWCWSHARLSRE